ncbi:50S ribosomal protein L29 [Desulfurivibrio sp. D14AmB]|uniref:Large ribosomal subunit protein uL29 n=1 Tax=Desulfurivibrio alkaliphilus TaxID=427923 RepID=A0A7C2TK13_9BACT|nr:50S ribosomal protein L29 [Desulfurivibrio alkaliphilus]
MKIKDIRLMSADEMGAKVRELSEELCRLKFQHGIRPLENTAKIQQTRKAISRIKTVLQETASR